MANTFKCFGVLGMFCSVLIFIDLKHWTRIMSDDAIQCAENLKIINDSAEREVTLTQA
jgi:hypothetical protein